MRRLLSPALVIASLGVVFGWRLPQFIDYEEVWDALTQLDASELVVLLGLSLARVPTEALMYRAFLPGLSLWRGTEAYLSSNLAGQVLPPPARRPTIPQAEWDDVRVYVPLDQRIKVKRAGEFERVARVRERRLFPEDLAAVAGDAVMTFRASMTGEVDRAACLADAHALWSMWAGYLDEPSGLRLRAWLSARGVPLTALHSSGHASVPDLRRLAAAVGATRVVPLHTRHPERYGEVFANVDRRADGEWWTV